jgi:hypothetical protein
MSVDGDEEEVEIVEPAGEDDEAELGQYHISRRAHVQEMDFTCLRVLQDNSPNRVQRWPSCARLRMWVWKVQRA